MAMRRRTFLLGSISSLFVATASLAASLVGITGLWVEGPTNNTRAGAVRGVIHFRVKGESWERKLTSYVNDRPRNGAAGKRECVELIKRYAANLGFPRFNKAKIGRGDDGNTLPSLGNGVDCAANFASRSEGNFRYYRNGQADLPKPGAVVSTKTWSGVPGHVGILCNYDRPSSRTTRLRVKLFDQNMTGSWKEVVFTKKNGIWRGEITVNASRGITIDLQGWADPRG